VNNQRVAAIARRVVVAETMTTADEMVGKIKEIMERIFPGSTNHVQHSKNLKESIYIRFAIGKKSDWGGGIAENTPVSFSAFIWEIKDSQLSDEMVYEPRNSNAYITIKPVKNLHMAYESIKVPARKTKGNAARILKAIERNLTSLKAKVKENIDAMMPEHQWVEKYV